MSEEEEAEMEKGRDLVTFQKQYFMLIMRL
jgi:hypothetical protein